VEHPFIWTGPERGENPDGDVLEVSDRPDFSIYVVSNVAESK
jgi:hypothetical protein